MMLMLLAFYFMWSITNQTGQPVEVKIVTKDVVDNFDNQVVCERVRAAAIHFVQMRIAHLPGWGSSFSDCEPDRPDKRPR